MVLGGFGWILLFFVVFGWFWLVLGGFSWFLWFCVVLVGFGGLERLLLN